MSYRDYAVFHEGEVVGYVELNQTIEKIKARDRIELWENRAATEPRWDAINAYAVGVSGDPNEAILDCAWKTRLAKRAGRVAPERRIRSLIAAKIPPRAWPMFGPR